ncbi:hypothetical protein AVEN_241140-1 [Araneus ventricosus]|uniref:Uncharacterized protein n=1 Tax=Araneus ventricosus TaxID=182803 RepID=A0A4Y2WBE3_ARAVE|nr:hypothetical protein AVEN_241140-1 [Araneus ventricosus]
MRSPPPCECGGSLERWYQLSSLWIMYSAAKDTDSIYLDPCKKNGNDNSQYFPPDADSICLDPSKKNGNR